MFSDFAVFDNWLDGNGESSTNTLEPDAGNPTDSNDANCRDITQEMGPFDGELYPETDWDPMQFDGIGNPTEEADFWQQQEGQNSCAVVAQRGIYESITGVELSEAELCQIAETNGWYDPEVGTYPEDMDKVLNTLGIPTTQHYDATLTDIADALERGDKVIVGLDGSEIWTPMRDPVTGSPVEQTNSGHAVWVTGIDQEPDGSVSIILNDSGTPDGQMKAVDAGDFLNAWEDHSNLLVVADAPDQVMWA
jgi:hypothetical protein